MPNAQVVFYLPEDITCEQANERIQRVIYLPKEHINHVTYHQPMHIEIIINGQDVNNVVNCPLKNQTNTSQSTGKEALNSMDSKKNKNKII